MKLRNSKVSVKEPENCPEENEVNFSMFQEMYDDDVCDIANKLVYLYCVEDVDTQELDRE